MKRNEITDSVNEQPVNQADNQAANDNFNETDLREFEASSEYYERRRLPRRLDGRTSSD